MAPDHPHQRTQEQSIKARKHQLFEVDEPLGSLGPRQSFRDCLRTTPAEPLSTPVKALLWAVGVVVILLLVAALATGGRKKEKARRADASARMVVDPTAADRPGWRGRLRRAGLALPIDAGPAGQALPYEDGHIQVNCDIYANKLIFKISQA